MSDDLKPCPFCGEPAYEQAHEHTHIYMGFMPEHGGSYTVECTACSAGVIEDARDKARALWNRRTAPEKEALAAHVERLKETFHELVGCSDDAKELAGYVLVQECDFDCVVKEFKQAPQTSLARHDACVAADAVQGLIDKVHNRGGRMCIGEVQREADELRRQADGGGS